MDSAGSSRSDATVSNCADANIDLANFFNETANGEKRNALSVYCPRCPSLILRPGSGVYVDAGCRTLPNMQVKLKSKNSENATQAEDTSAFQHFWAVADIFTFENVGYTNTVDGRYKYLTCADCECGPLGVQVISDEDSHSTGIFKKNFSYLALGRVLHR